MEKRVGGGALAAAAEDDERLRRDLELLEGYRVLDDAFMRAVFRDNLPLAQRVLRVLTGIRDLELVKEETQRDLKSVTGARSVVLDVFCTDGEGTLYDMEVQTGNSLDPLRFRYYGSSMDLDFLKSGGGYSDLPRRWIVAVLEEDPDGPSRATRRYRTLGDDGAEYGDGVCYLYANASYRGDDELGSLMADFCQSDPSKIVDGLLRERVQYLKGTGQGRIEMCRMSERIYNEGRERGDRDRLVECVRSLMENVGWSAQKALENLGVPEVERAQYLAALQDAARA